MQASEKYKDKVVLITGGTKGIGIGIAKGFLSAGAKVVVCGRQEVESLPQVTVDGEVRQANFIQADVKDIDSTAAMFSKIEQEYGTLDVLIKDRKSVV